MSYTLREASDKLQISMSTARRWVKTGKMKAFLIEGTHGEEYQVEDEEVLRLLTEQLPDATESVISKRIGFLEDRIHEWMELMDRRLEENRIETLEQKVDELIRSTNMGLQTMGDQLQDVMNRSPVENQIESLLENREFQSLGMHLQLVLSQNKMLQKMLQEAFLKQEKSIGILHDWCKYLGDELRESNQQLRVMNDQIEELKKPSLLGRLMKKE